MATFVEFKPPPTVSVAPLVSMTLPPFEPPPESPATTWSKPLRSRTAPAMSASTMEEFGLKAYLLPAWTVPGIDGQAARISATCVPKVRGALPGAGGRRAQRHRARADRGHRQSWGAMPAPDTCSPTYRPAVLAKPVGAGESETVARCRRGSQSRWTGRSARACRCRP